MAINVAGLRLAEAAVRMGAPRRSAGRSSPLPGVDDQSVSSSSPMRSWRRHFGSAARIFAHGRRESRVAADRTGEARRVLGRRRIVARPKRGVLVAEHAVDARRGGCGVRWDAGRGCDGAGLEVRGCGGSAAPRAYEVDEFLQWQLLALLLDDEAHSLECEARSASTGSGPRPPVSASPTPTTAPLRPA